MTKSFLPVSRQIGHLSGVVAYGLVSTGITAGVAVLEATVNGLINTGSQLGIAWQQLKAPVVEMPQKPIIDAPQKPVFDVPPVAQRSSRTRKAAANA